jgi:uncharacterized protein YndB with AHSA1/START domain
LRTRSAKRGCLPPSALWLAGFGIVSLLRKKEEPMTLVSDEVQIHRPIEEVFDFLADGTNNSLWQSKTVTTAQVDDDLLGVGTSFQQLTRHPLGFIVPSNYRVIEFDRPHNLKLVTTSPSPMHPVETFSLTEKGKSITLLSCSVEYRLRGMTRMLSPVLSVLRPLFIWEASWINNARDVMECAL